MPSSDLRSIVDSFGPGVAVVCFEACGITRDRPEKRQQAIHNRDYMGTIARDVTGGLVYVRHPEAAPEGLDFLLNIDHFNPRRYHVAAELSIDFPRSDGTGGRVLPDRQRRLVEKILDLHRKTDIPLEYFYDQYRVGTWEHVRHFFPEYPSSDAYSAYITDPRALVLELATGLTVAAHTPRRGAVLTRQPYTLHHPRDGIVTSDIDVLLITSHAGAQEALASLSNEPGATVAIASPAVPVERFVAYKEAA